MYILYTCLTLLDLAVNHLVQNVNVRRKISNRVEIEHHRCPTLVPEEHGVTSLSKRDFDRLAVSSHRVVPGRRVPNVKSLIFHVFRDFFDLQTLYRVRLLKIQGHNQCTQVHLRIGLKNLRNQLVALSIFGSCLGSGTTN